MTSRSGPMAFFLQWRRGQDPQYCTRTFNNLFTPPECIVCIAYPVQCPLFVDNRAQSKKEGIKNITSGTESSFPQ
jgi:hypothetical protein